SLASGVTSARVHLFDLVQGPAFKARAADDCFPAPRFQMGGPGFILSQPNLDSRQAVGARDLADGTEKLRRARAAGAEWIAFHEAGRFDHDLFLALAAEARRQGFRVMVAADTPANLARGLEAHADTLEYLDRTAAPLADGALPKDTVLVAAIGSYGRTAAYRDDPSLVDRPGHFAFMDAETARAVAEAAKADLANPKTTPNWLANVPLVQAKFRRLLAAGAPVVLATDAGSPSLFHDDAIWWELRTWREMGASADQALTAATVLPARRVLRDASVGALKAGKRGDFVLYRGDVADGFDQDRLRAVAKGGVLYVDEGRWVGPPV
ncbi:MAG: amidohydrolase family protein, partial [Phenylobacterium sp.]